ncbi:hypothetical protein ACTLPF_004529, partial [Escherichia coli]
LRQKQKKLIMLPSEIMIWQPEFTDKILSRKPGAVQPAFDVGLNISKSGNYTNLCTGSHTISDTTIRGITLHLYAGEHIDAGLYIFNRDFN